MIFQINRNKLHNSVSCICDDLVWSTALPKRFAETIGRPGLEAHCMLNAKCGTFQRYSRV